jgi:hypothetical protein
MRVATFLAVCGLSIPLAAAPAAAYDGDAAAGEDLAQEHCSRCHVIGDYNKYGGLNSTPSFQGLLRMTDWRERFETFFARRPHQVFVRMPGLESPSLSPSHVTPFDFDEDKLQDLLTYVEGLKTE